MKNNEINQLEKILNIKFTNKILLKQAFTHKSKSINISINNERLEFLGDRVLGLVIASYLNDTYPKDTEGKLDKKLASLVNKETCSKVISELKIDQFGIRSKNFFNENIQNSSDIINQYQKVKKVKTLY